MKVVHSRENFAVLFASLLADVSAVRSLASRVQNDLVCRGIYSNGKDSQVDIFQLQETHQETTSKRRNKQINKQKQRYAGVYVAIKNVVQCLFIYNCVMNNDFEIPYAFVETNKVDLNCEVCFRLLFSAVVIF